MEITDSTTTEELAAILKENGLPEPIIQRLQDEFIDGESFLEMSKDMVYMQLIPQYGLQVKFRKIFLKLTGRKLMKPGNEEGVPAIPSATLDVAASTSSVEVPQTLTNEEVCQPEPVGSQLNCAASSGDQLHLTAPVNTQSFGKSVPFPAPLPTFSLLVQQKLIDGNVEAVWHKFISELAEYYIAKKFNIYTQLEYTNIGQTLIGKYSCFPKNTSGTPWTYFNKALSAKVRNMKMQIKRKSDPSLIKKRPTGRVAPLTALQRAKFQRIGNEGEMPDPSDEKYEEYVLEMRGAADKCHLNALLRNTFKGRRKWISTIPDGDLKIIMEIFPVFKEEWVIMEEFKYLVGPGRYSSMADNFDRAMGTVDRILGAEPLPQNCSVADIDRRDLHNITTIYSQSRFDKGKGCKSQPCWTLVEESDDPAALIKSKAKEPPHLFICVEVSQRVTSQYIYADDIRICQCGDDVKAGFLSLLGVYYAFDLEFPRIYSQFLGFLQHHVLGQDYNGPKSAKYHKFEQRFVGQNK